LSEPTLVVNLFAGPGVGKSTTAAALFAALKERGRNVEIAHEFAKDLTWEGRQRTLAYQPYVCAKQMWRVERLRGEVEAVITDSPILFSGFVYDAEGCTPEFRQWVHSVHNSWWTYNVVLERDPKRWYNPAGRSQSEEEAIRLDSAIDTVLYNLEIPHQRLRVADLKRDPELLPNFVEGKLASAPDPQR
jgi:hypothetical protein